MEKLLSTREVARFLGVNEKMVYTLISEKGLPATKVTGKWLFPARLVEQWVESHTINYPEGHPQQGDHRNLLVIAGSNDILLDRTISLFNRIHADSLAVFGNLGSLGGLRALRRGMCHMASSHLLQDDERDYNFGFAKEELGGLPAVVNFCKRRQGLIVAKGNPKSIRSVADLGKEDVLLANRPLGTGTRLLLDRELEKAGLEGDKIPGYHNEFDRHIDVGLEILGGRADVAPGIAIVASLLDLDFIPLRWERFDLLISRDKFFDRTVQNFLGLFHEDAFRELAGKDEGYDLTMSGRMLFPREAAED